MRYPKNCMPFTILNILLGARFQGAEPRLIAGGGGAGTGRPGLPLNIAGPGAGLRARFDVTKCEVSDFSADK